MSGLEAIGLALAAAPLAVCVLEQYRHALQPFKIWASYESDIELLCEMIECEETKLHNTSEHILNTAFPPQLVNRLMELPEDLRWSSPSMQREMSNILGNSTHSFCRAAHRFHDALEDLRKTLRAHDSTRVRRRSRSIHCKENWVLMSLLRSVNMVDSGGKCS